MKKILCGIITFIFIILTFNIFFKVETDKNIIYKKALFYDKEYNDNLNSDIIGKIIIKNDFNILLNSYFVQTNNNDFYLTHDLNKQENKMGTIFLDYRNQLTDRQLNIYGHNAHSDLGPFHILEKYLDEDFYKQYPNIYLNIDNQLLTYQIFIIAKTSTYEHMNINFYNDYEWNKHINKLKELSIYQIDNSSNINQILILQTCIMDSNPKEYLLIIANKV